MQIIAALLHRPTALVLDEPFSGLDPAAVDAMADILRDHAASGVPVLFSSHQLDLVERLCDHLIVLARGRVVAQGAVDALRAGGPTRYRLVTDADAGWVRDVRGIHVHDVDGSAVLLELVTEGAEQAVLREAVARGAVREFSPGRAAVGRDLPRGDRMMTIRQTDRPGHGPAGHDPAGRDDPSGAAAPGAGLPHAWALVARREISSKLVDRTFLVGTLLTLLMIAGFVVLAQALLSERVDELRRRRDADGDVDGAGRGRPGHRPRRQGERRASSTCPTTPPPGPR